MAPSNSFPSPQLPKLSPPRTAESGGELPSLRRPLPTDSGVFADGLVPGAEPTQSVSADDSVVRPAPELGPDAGGGVNGDGAAPFLPELPPVPEITARYRGRIGQYQIKDFADQPGLGL